MSGLGRLLRPQTVAVIGGGVWCANVIEQCQKIGFTGEIWPVHPTRDMVGGLPAYRSVEDLPASPDATFVGINRDATVEVVKALSKAEAGGAICLASGFRESQAETGDGQAKQQALLDAAGEMPFFGPNCYGFVNYLDGVALWPDQHGGVRVERGVAIVTQSSNISINLTMQNRGLPVAYLATVGNQAQLGLSRIARALLEDDRVTALGLHIEGIDELQEFEALAKEAWERGKPIIALKVGISDQAQAAAVSHTASLAGSDAGAEALLKRLGIGRTSSLPVFLETLKLLHVTGPLVSNRIASMSCSGGEASLIADLVHGSGLEFPELDERQERGLREALGPKVALANPLDYHTYIWGNAEALSQTFTEMMRGDLAIGCVVLDYPRTDRCDASEWEHVVEATVRTGVTTGKPMAIAASLQETMPEELSTRLIDFGIVPFAGLDEAVRAIKIAADLGRYRDAAEPILLPGAVKNTRTMTEAEAKTALSAEGVRIPAAKRVDSPEAAANAAKEIGFPVVVKGEGIAHKTEAGAVVLNLESPQAVESAARAMLTQSFLVEEQITDVVVEVLVGVVMDPAHGYVLTLAAGGTLTELLEDSASLLVPASRAEVRAAIDSLKIARLLGGYRGKAAANLDAILDAVMAVQSFVAAALPQEIEINPLLCGSDRAVAADALIRIGD